MNPNVPRPEISHALFISPFERFNLGRKALSRLHRYICDVLYAHDTQGIRDNLNILRSSYSNLYKDRYQDKPPLSLEGEALGVIMMLAEHCIKTSQFKDLEDHLTHFAKDLIEEANAKYDLAGATLVFTQVGISHEGEVDQIVKLSREVVNDTNLVSLWGGQRDVVQQEKITAGLNLIFPLS